MTLGETDGTSTVAMDSSMSATATPATATTTTTGATSIATDTSSSSIGSSTVASTTDPTSGSSGDSSTAGDEMTEGSSTSGEELPVLASCSDLLAFSPGLADGIYIIDPDGPGAINGLEVYCDMTRDGGGWTLVMVSSDDGTPTWSFANADLMTGNETTLGDVRDRNRDFKSIAMHRVPFSALMFAHEPSGIWAVYEVPSNGMDLGSFMGSLPSPHCDAALPGNGIPLTAGTLTVEGDLCDTDLYFHVADWDGGAVTACADPLRPFNNATFGPLWNRAANGGCPFDDPVDASLGPSIQCVDCNPGEGMLERQGVGFGLAIGANTGMPTMAENYMHVLVR